MQQVVVHVRRALRRPAAKTELRPQDDSTVGHRVYEDVWLAISFSVFLHLLLALALAIWKYLDEPGPSGVVIHSALSDEGLGAETLDPLPVFAGEAGGDETDNANRPDATLVDLSQFLRKSASLTDLSAHSAGLGAAPGASGLIGTGGRGGGVGFFGTLGEGRSFVFIVDRSGSMEGARIHRAREELIRAIGELRAYQRFYVFFYNNKAHPLFDQPVANETLLATREAKQRAIHWILRCNAGGGTKPEEAFHMALSLRPDVIFFLTDGKIPDDSREMVRKANRHGTVVHATAFQSREGEHLLKGIVADNGGIYRFVP